MPELTCAEIEEQALIERYVAGRLSDDDVEVLESHYLTCPRCYAELRFAVAIRATLPAIAEDDTRLLRILHGRANRQQDPSRPGRRRVAPHGGRRGWRIKAGAAASMAAAAVLAGLLLLRPIVLTDEPASIQRDDASRVEAALLPQAPVGEVAVVGEFRWSPLPSADRYRVTLFDSAGEVIWKLETTETRAVLPRETRLQPGESYLWQVAARVDWNRWVRSEFVQFEISNR